MAKPDKVFQQTYAWYRASIARVIAASAIPAAQQPQVEALVWQMLGVLNAAAPPVDPDLADFQDSGADAASLAVAATIVSEVLVALGHVRQAVDALGSGGNPAAALAIIGPVLDQVDRITKLDANSRYPSAFSIGKMLLMLSGDADAVPLAGHEADRLAQLLGAATPAAMSDAQAALGVVALVVGSAIDRSFKAPTAQSAAGWVQQAIPSFVGKPTLTLAGPGGIAGTLELDPGPPSAMKAALQLAFNQSRPLDGTQITLGLTSSAGVDLLVPIAPPGPVKASGAFAFGIELKRKGNALKIGSDALGATIAIDELGIALKLENAEPRLGFFARNAKATLKPNDGFLKLILGDGISVDLSIEAEADRAGKLRLVNGTGLRVSLPVPTLPTGPFELQLINLGVAPEGGNFRKLQVEVSASFGVELGPFQASVDRLGALLTIDVQGGPAIAFAFKPPNGIGLALDAGIVKGGGYLGVDENGYAGVLELKMLAVGVKAIALLNTKSEAGFSLLLLIFGQFPAIQLSFGFTLTGVGGLIGVQHTTDQDKLSQGLSNGNLDSVLFPENPVANAPQIIANLRSFFPVKKGGFIIGPMLEVGWGTPSLVTVRMGLLIEAEQFTILGQAIVALPPLISADLALLYLRLDFKGYVRFSPLEIGFDAKLIHSRVAFISITGQFAFRARFGDDPTFLISAGGFHPRFKEIPSNIPMPFDRVGCSFDIGIVGLSYKGYFAITSATIQAGSELRVWADIGIAGIEGGFGFDAICYLVPKFYFDIGVHAYLAVHVFGLDFASIHLEGMLAGPGRWRIAGKAEVHTPWPLPDFSLSVDESWGTDRATPAVTVNVAEQLAKQIADVANWSAQLPRGGEAFLTLAAIDAPGALLAHPLGTLVFQQKLVPFDLQLAKASGSRIAGANHFSNPALVLTQDAAPVAPIAAPVARTDYFAAAQFLEMSEDDRLSKPSFEAFTAGYEIGSDDFELGEIVEETLNYEEADLGAVRLPKRQRRLGLGLYVDAYHGPALAYGAAGKSAFRDRALTQPAQATPLGVKPAPVAVVDKVDTAIISGVAVRRSVWQAVQARDVAAATHVGALVTAELAELSA